MVEGVAKVSALCWIFSSVTEVRENEGGAECWRSLVVLNRGVVRAGFTADSWEGRARDAFLFVTFAGLAISALPFKGRGRENMDGLGCGDRVEFSPTTSVLVNWVHSESRSMVDVEGGLGEVAGIRVHSTLGSWEGGRSGGGYVVGNA